MVDILRIYGTLVKVKNKIDGPEYREIWLGAAHLIVVLEAQYGDTRFSAHPNSVKNA
jgi:hypothetical protein